MRLGIALLALGLAPGVLAGQERQPIYPGGARTAGPYTPGIRVGNLLFVSGQLGFAPGGRGLVPGGIQAETRQALENIGRVLEAAGTSFARVAKCNVYLTDVADFAAMNEVYTTFWPNDPPPARTTVAVAALPAPGARVEIECIASVS